MSNIMIIQTQNNYSASGVPRLTARSSGFLPLLLQLTWMMRHDGTQLVRHLYGEQNSGQIVGIGLSCMDRAQGRPLFPLLRFARKHHRWDSIAFFLQQSRHTPHITHSPESNSRFEAMAPVGQCLAQTPQSVHLQLVDSL